MIKINIEVIEMMLFFWQSCKENDKVSDVYLTQLANRDEFRVLFNDEFNAESIRKVLSAITNREVLSSRTKTEGLFWNNNMWMTEDLSVTNMMIEPIKKLNLDHIDSNRELIFLPGHSTTFYEEGDKVYINFFKIMVDLFNGTNDVTIEGVDFEEYIVHLVTK